MAINLDTAEELVPSMTIQIFLNKVGVPWPLINERDVHNFAQLVRQFSTAVTTTHQNATNAVQAIAQNYQGPATQAMMSGWSNLTNTQVNLLTEACTILAAALDAGAAWIIAQKISCLTALAWMAGEVIADQFVAVETLFVSEIVALGTIALARQMMIAFVEALVAYVVGELVGKAIQPFIAKLAQFTAGLDWSKSGATAGPPVQVLMVPAAVQQQASVLQGLATSLTSQVAGLTSQMQALQFA
jgi:hypothetical protein